MMVLNVVLQGLLCNNLVNLLVFENVWDASIRVMGTQLRRLTSWLLYLVRVHRDRALVTLPNLAKR